MIDLHPQLKQDGLLLGRFPLCLLLLIKDANYPWFALVPSRENITEIYQLSDQDQVQLTRESSLLSQALAAEFDADKMNIAAIGNMVPQLHIHHIVRYKDDICWPSPVWGEHAAKKYSDEQLKSIFLKIKTLKLPGFENFIDN